MLQAQSTNSKHFKRIMQENYDLLQDSAVQPTPPVATRPAKAKYIGESAEPGQLPPCTCFSSYNQIPGSNDPPAADEGAKMDYSKRLNPPIFLKRNMKLMQKIRESAPARLQVNGLVQRIVPHLNQLTFDKEGEDAYIAHRRKSQLKVSECHKIQLQKQLKANQIRSKRLKLLS